MQDRLTFLCLACGMRQPDGRRCVGCQQMPLGDLRTATLRADTLAVLGRSTRELHAFRLMRDAPEARRAGWSFALGGFLMTSPMAAFVAAIAGVPAAALVVVTGASAAMTIGEALRRAAPRVLVGRARQRELDADVIELARTSRRELAPPRAIERSEQITLTGTIEGEMSESPFGSVVLAERVVGEVCGQPLDDAWVSGTRWTLRTSSDVASDTEVDLSGGIRILTPPTGPMRIESPSKAAFEFLAARAITVSASGADLNVAHVLAGQRVTITGTRRMEPRPDGYRGTKDHVVVAGPLSVTRLD